MSHASKPSGNRLRQRSRLALADLGNWVFSRSDTAARECNWQVYRTSRHGRAYRDPRFDLFVRCGECNGTGVLPYQVPPCGRCGGTGRRTVSPTPTEPAWR